MPEPTTVWMVHLRRGQDVSEVEGGIELESEALVFTGKKDGAPISFPFANVRHAKRLRGSPVLLLEWEWDGDHRKTAVTDADGRFTATGLREGVYGVEELPTTTSSSGSPPEPRPCGTIRAGDRDVELRMPR